MSKIFLTSSFEEKSSESGRIWEKFLSHLAVETHWMREDKNAHILLFELYKKSKVCGNKSRLQNVCVMSPSWAFFGKKKILKFKLIV